LIYTFPIIDQLTAAGLTKALQQSHRPIIIGCSANVDDSLAGASLLVGMDAFVPKPITLSKLNDILLQLP
jgi:CheY-like chemotaxis protein